MAMRGWPSFRALGFACGGRFASRPQRRMMEALQFGLTTHPSEEWSSFRLKPIPPLRPNAGYVLTFNTTTGTN
jgi:hypothetical protein